MKTVYLLLILIVFLMSGCKKDDNNVTNPSNQQNTITDIDGNVYHTVTIGTQTWTVENLKVTRYRNGDAISNITDNTQWINNRTGAYCNYDNSVGNGNTYGHLYNYYAVIDSRNIAPSGWHVPSDAEWVTLVSSLGSESIVGGNLKESGTTHWSSPNTGADNSSGFTALPGGERYYDVNSLTTSFTNIGTDGYWWSTTKLFESNDPHTWILARRLNYNSRQVTRMTSSITMLTGCSVRLVKD